MIIGYHCVDNGIQYYLKKSFLPVLMLYRSSKATQLLDLSVYSPPNTYSWVPILLPDENALGVGASPLVRARYHFQSSVACQMIAVRNSLLVSNINISAKYDESFFPPNITIVVPKVPVNVAAACPPLAFGVSLPIYIMNLDSNQFAPVALTFFQTKFATSKTWTSL
jgi:hypothetical protein